MQSAFLNLKGNDFAKGLVVAVLAAIFATLAQWFNAPGFDFATFQWDELAKIAAGAAIAYLSKNLFSHEGKFVGKI